VAITRDRQIAGVYAGHLEKAHEAGCRQVAQWTTASIDSPYDLVITSGGGWPLDATFYQTAKGICGALPALKAGSRGSFQTVARAGKPPVVPQKGGFETASTLLVVSECCEQLGSRAFTNLMLAHASDWRRFLSEIAASEGTRLDQWELQMQCRVLERIGVEHLLLVSDGIPAGMQHRIGVTPVVGEGDARQRAQRAIDTFLAEQPGGRVAVIPDGPYTMLCKTVSS
jgi:hypothetical protein